MIEELRLLEKLGRPLLLARRVSGGEERIKSLDRYFNSVLKKVDEKKISTQILSRLRNLAEIIKGYDFMDAGLKKQNLLKLMEELLKIREEILEEAFKESREKLLKDITFVHGIGPKIASLFRKKNINTIEDLLYYIPRRFENRGDIIPISRAVPGTKQVVRGKIELIEEINLGGRKIFEVLISDGTGFMSLKWFNYNRNYMRMMYRKDMWITASGEVKVFRRRMEMVHPEVDLSGSGEDIAGFIPVYSEIEGLYKRQMRKIMRTVVEEFSPYVMSAVPIEVEMSLGLMDLRKAIFYVHFPEENLKDEKEISKRYAHAKKRIIFEELFLLQTALALRAKKMKSEKGIRLNCDVKLYRDFLNSLPFKLTGAQKRVLHEIEKDLSSPSPMNRLLQGDVGCGKTVVAMAATAIVVGNNYQVAVMAPTEVLAEQHFRNFSRYLGGLGVKICLLTSSSKTERGRYLRLLRSGEINLAIGTHAIIQEEVEFKNLALGIIDEQHRFGVVQRAALRKKGLEPHILVMTATPIPRTLAMTLYGDLDLSVIDEMPPGRKPVITRVFKEDERPFVYNRVRDILRKGFQGYVVLPLIEESEKVDLKSAINTYRKLASGIFSEFNVGLMHGRLKQEERDDVMRKFQKGEIHLLVSTTVIEVGVDIPNACVMVVENAERFGLSQLHQLRGRVGRGSEQSYFFLIHSHPVSEKGMMRLKIMEETNDGFIIAEKDMEIRGPGELFGTRQWGMSDSKMMELLSDPKLINLARSEAFKVIDGYYPLTEAEKKIIHSFIEAKWGEKLELSRVG